jgi:hypothetical protein
MKEERTLRENAGQSPDKPGAATEPHGAASSCPAGLDQHGPDTASRRSGRSRWTGWPKIFLGQTILRVCPSGRSEEPCEGCELRALCKCAQTDFLQAARVERTVWAVLSACGAATILCWLFWP